MHKIKRKAFNLKELLMLFSTKSKSDLTQVLKKTFVYYNKNRPIISGQIAINFLLMFEYFLLLFYAFIINTHVNIFCLVSFFQKNRIE